ncbi:MAG: copper transport protein, partial [Chloroflexota bacterium]|nr:copper transport protein [Chloroflexota bacterium]
MRTGRSLVIAATLGLGAVAGLPLTAAAHALPQSATPAQGAEVQTAPKAAEITFGEIPDPRLSSITVINGSGVSVDAGTTLVVPGHPLELEVPLKSIGDGVYTVTWKTVSEVDGHLATGAYAFGVGVSAAGASTRAGKAVVSPPPSILAVAGRWLFFIGVMGIIGVASTCLMALRAMPSFTARVLLATWVAAALGVAALIEAEREAAGIGFGALFSTSLGTTALERIVALVATGLGVAATLSAR